MSILRRIQGEISNNDQPSQNGETDNSKVSALQSRRINAPVSSKSKTLIKILRNVSKLN